MSWTSQGFWREKKVPIIYATLWHPLCNDRLISWEFVLDSGADISFISPEHMSLLGITNDKLVPTAPIETLGGSVKFGCLSGCSLFFTDDKGNQQVFKLPYIYFPPVPLGWRHNLCKKVFGCHNSQVMSRDTKVYPSLLGRDVLRQLSLGFCQNSDVLFISQHYNNYRSALDDFIVERPDA